MHETVFCLPPDDARLPLLVRESEQSQGLVRIGDGEAEAGRVDATRGAARLESDAHALAADTSRMEASMSDTLHLLGRFGVSDAYRRMRPKPLQSRPRVPETSANARATVTDGAHVAFSYFDVGAPTVPDARKRKAVHVPPPSRLGRK